jgi:hypothetical protein
MRPQSPIRVDLAAALIDGGGTTRQLAQRTGWSIGLTCTALNNMVQAGDACKPRTVRVPGVKRPVPVYEKAVRTDDQNHSHQALGAILAGWSRWPAYAGAGATM